LKLTILFTNFVKQINQAILLRSIKKQEKLLIAALKKKLNESTALGSDDNSTTDNTNLMATSVCNEKAVCKQPEGSKPSQREGIGLQD
jgi:hypothetical protein